VSSISAGWQELAAGTSSVHVAVDRLDAVGPDTIKFLHSLVSQNIADLAVGSGAWTFLLQPQGKVTSFAYARRLADEHVVLLTDAGFGEALHTALSRYRIRTKCELTLHLGSSASVSFADGVPTFAVSETPIPFAGGQGPTIYNTARIVNGWPIQPNEITESTIPNETGVLRQSVNFTKGCYVGQELVERIDSRAATTPRRLVRLVDFVVPGVAVGAEGLDDVDLNALGGAELRVAAVVVSDTSPVSVPVLGSMSADGAGVDEGVVDPGPAAKAVGVLTSVVRTAPGVAGMCALAYVTRAVADGSHVAISGTALTATVAVLRDEASVVTVAPAGVRSSATMGRKG
jgi:tRNA-modifying protein YgfZ